FAASRASWRRTRCCRRARGGDCGGGGRPAAPGGGAGRGPGGGGGAPGGGPRGGGQRAAPRRGRGRPGGPRGGGRAAGRGGVGGGAGRTGVALRAALVRSRLVAWAVPRLERALPPLQTSPVTPRLFPLGRARLPCLALVLAAAAALFAVPLVSLLWKVGQHG